MTTPPSYREQDACANAKHGIVLVCGGRDYADAAHVSDELHALSPFRVVCGGATGADALAVEWAIKNEVAHSIYPARAKRDGWPQAGPMRNQRMLDSERIDIVLAFPGGRGTADMVRRATAKGVPVRICPAHERREAERG